MDPIDPTLTEPVRGLLRKLADECFALAGFDPTHSLSHRVGRLETAHRVARVLESLGSYLACMADDIRSPDPARHAETLTGLVGNLVRDCRLPAGTEKPIFTMVDRMMGREPPRTDDDTAREVIAELEDLGLVATWETELGGSYLRLVIPMLPSEGEALALLYGTTNGEWSGHLAMNDDGTMPAWPAWEPPDLPLDADAESIAKVLVDGFNRYEMLSAFRRLLQERKDLDSRVKIQSKGREHTSECLLGRHLVLGPHLRNAGPCWCGSPDE